MRLFIVLLSLSFSAFAQEEEFRNPPNYCQKGHFDQLRCGEWLHKNNYDSVKEKVSAKAPGFTSLNDLSETHKLHLKAELAFEKNECLRVGGENCRKLNRFSNAFKRDEMKQQLLNEKESKKIAEEIKTQNLLAAEELKAQKLKEKEERKIASIEMKEDIKLQADANKKRVKELKADLKQKKQKALDLLETCEMSLDLEEITCGGAVTYSRTKGQLENGRQSIEKEGSVGEGSFIPVERIHGNGREN